MKTDLVDKILQYALARAAQEDFGNRELGPIHLLKLVYLSDLEFAKTHGGQTFTETPWRFHHFGPWDFSAFQRIAPVMEGIGASARPVVSARFESETTFWSLDPRDAGTERLYVELDGELPARMTLAISRAIHDFGRDTSALLDFVYKTPPMTVAAPGELLDFSQAVRAPRPSFAMMQDGSASLSLSRRQKRTQEELKQGLLEKLRKTPAGSPRPGCVVPPPAPRDQIFADGVRWLDCMAGAPVPEILDGVLDFDHSVWRSDMRTPSELS
ncbi:MAG: hypothetical protein Q8O00_00995 [Holophaga sp.]|nr:hypothetical protein [Holophaga sp.]